MIMRLLEVGILAIWAIFLTWLVSLGRQHLARLLHPNLWWLVAAAAVILILLLIARRRQTAASRTDQSLFWQWPGLVILMLPLLFFFPAAQARFDTNTFSDRSISLGGGPLPGGISDSEVAPAEAGGGIPLTQLTYNTVRYAGKEVEVACQILVNERFPADVAVCYRYLMNCCAADARPIFILLQHTAPQPLENDRWVRAKGTLSVKNDGRIELPWLTAKSWEYIEEPEVPFLY